jgi:hypothetical protein
MMDKDTVVTNGHSASVSPIPAVSGQDSTPKPDSPSLQYDILTSDVEKQELSSINRGQENASSPKRKGVFRAFLVLAILAAVAIGGFFWLTGGSRKKIDLAIRDRNAQSERTNPQRIDDVTAQAIAEVRATASPSPSPAAITSSAGVTNLSDPTLATIPLGGTVAGIEGAPPAGAPSPSSTDASAASSETQVKRNSETSIRCAPSRKIDTSSSKQIVAVAPSMVSATRASTLEKAVPLPPFGALLPVKTLGAIYTLRSSLSRFELTRDLRGEGWMMRKGTVLIGQQQGSQIDRAYVNLTGFIDPATGKFVKLAGDTLGADGAPGLKGKRRRLGSRWARVLSRAASAAVTLGQAALSRGGSIVNVSGAVTPEIQGLSSNVVSSREFVEVAAGSPAFVLVTDLPKEIQGADPEPPLQKDKDDSSLGDQELANLLTEGSPDQIKSALPRMTPEFRKIAEAVLKEAANSDVTERSNQRKR